MHALFAVAGVPAGVPAGAEAPPSQRTGALTPGAVAHFAGKRWRPRQSGSKTEGGAASRPCPPNHRRPAPWSTLPAHAVRTGCARGLERPEPRPRPRARDVDAPLRVRRARPTRRDASSAAPWRFEGAGAAVWSGSSCHGDLCSLGGQRPEWPSGHPCRGARRAGRAPPPCRPPGLQRGLRHSPASGLLRLQFGSDSRAYEGDAAVSRSPPKGGRIARGKDGAEAHVSCPALLPTEDLGAQFLLPRGRRTGGCVSPSAPALLRANAPAASPAAGSASGLHLGVEGACDHLQAPGAQATGPSLTLSSAACTRSARARVSEPRCPAPAGRRSSQRARNEAQGSVECGKV